MRIRLALPIVLATAVRISAQTQTFISGTVTDGNKRPVAGAVLGADTHGGATDQDGHFSIGAEPGTIALKVVAPGFATLTKDYTVQADRPLFGLEITLTRVESSSTGAEVFSGEAVRAIVQRAAAEWGARHQNVVLSLQVQVREKWPGTMELPIPITTTNAIDIYIASPYGFYQTGIAEAVRKMESPVVVPYPASVAIVVTPKQIGSPDIEKIVIERNGQIVEPLGNALERTVFKSGLGVEAVVHAGVVTYPLSAFAPGATVRVTVIPRTGSNFVRTLDGATLSRIR